MTAPVRYRCTSCGNLTRFNVTAARTTRSFHHYTVGGELSVEQEEVLAETVEEVVCCWCGPAGAVDELPAGALAGTGPRDGQEHPPAD